MGSTHFSSSIRASSRRSRRTADGLAAKKQRQASEASQGREALATASPYNQGVPVVAAAVTRAAEVPPAAAVA